MTGASLARGVESLRGLEADWWALWHADPDATPFHAPAWLLPWAEVFQPEACCAVVWEGRALLPLFTLEGGRHVLPLGAGTTDWLGLVGEVDSDRLLADVARLLPESVVLDLPNLSPGSPLVRAATPPGWRDEVGEGEPCPGLDLPPRLSKSLRQNLRTARNRLDRQGRVEIARVAAPDIPAALDSLFRLHGARWQGRGEPGVLADPDVQAFHRRAAPLLEAAGILRLYALALDGRTVGVLHGVSAKGRFRYYIGGHDPGFAAASPGSLLIAHAMDAATLDGCRLFDLLRGQEPYKYRWGAVDRPSLRRRLVRP